MNKTEIPDPDDQPPLPFLLRHIRHAINATRYSLAGGKRLLQETAAQAEILYFASLLIAYWLVGASGTEFAFLSLFFLITLGLEALNTAVEVLVDHLTNEFADFAREAKDLGSFAVACGLVMITLYSVYVIVARLV